MKSPSIVGPDPAEAHRDFWSDSDRLAAIGDFLDQAVAALGPNDPIIIAHAAEAREALRLAPMAGKRSNAGAKNGSEVRAALTLERHVKFYTACREREVADRPTSRRPTQFEIMTYVVKNQRLDLKRSQLYAAYKSGAAEVERREKASGDHGASDSTGGKVAV